MAGNSPSEGWSAGLLQEQEARAKKSREWQKASGKPHEWEVELPKVYRPRNIGSPRNVLPGDRADVSGRGSLAMSHPASGEKVTLKNRSG